VGARMNFTLVSAAIPWWVLLAEAFAGIVIPLAVAAAPIWRSTRLTVRQAIDQCGVSPMTASWRRLARLARIRWGSRGWGLAPQERAPAGDPPVANGRAPGGGRGHVHDGPQRVPRLGAEHRQGGRDAPL